MKTKEITELKVLRDKLKVLRDNSQMKEQLLKDIKELQFHIDYHEKHLAEYKIKMQIAEYALNNLTVSEYGTV